MGLYSSSTCSSSASRKWSGKEAEEDLQALTAHVRKLTVKILIFDMNRVGSEGEVREAERVEGDCELGYYFDL